MFPKGNGRKCMYHPTRAEHDGLPINRKLKIWHLSFPRFATGWFRLNAQNCVPGNSSRRFFELDHEILHTYSGRQYLKLEEGFFFIWGFAVEISGF